MGVFFVVTLWSLVLLIVLNNTVFSKSYIKELANSVDLYTKIPKILYSSIEKNDQSLLSNNTFEKAFKQGIERKLLKTHFENVIDQVFDQQKTDVYENIDDLNESLIRSINKETDYQIGESERILPESVAFSKGALEKNRPVGKFVYNINNFIWVLSLLSLLFVSLMYYFSSTKSGKKLIWLGWFMVAAALCSLSIYCLLYLFDGQWIAQILCSGTDSSALTIKYFSDIIKYLMSDIKQYYLYLNIALFTLTLIIFVASNFFEMDKKEYEGSKWWNYIK